MPVDPLAFARDLVRCRSVTPAEGGALDLLARTLAPLGFAVHRVTFSAPGTPDVENLFATIGEGRPHLVFAGHTDVVPPGDAAAWSAPPFAGEVIDGRLIGRGAVDMKGGIAAMVAAASAFLAARDLKSGGTLSFLITGDEEGPAVNGTRKLLDWTRERGVVFDHCVLGEPTSVAELGDTLKVGRRGSLSGTLVVEGTQGHVAYPHRADNPIRRLARILSHLYARPLDGGTAQFQPSNLEFVSVDTGNPAFNVIPAKVEARFNIRFNDRWTPASLRAHIEAEIGVAAPVGRWRVDWDPTVSECFLTPSGPFTQLVSDAVFEVTGRRPEPSTGGGTSDARFIKSACPVVELGLVGTTMHQIDEAVPVAELEALTAIYRRILERYFAG
ncbi:succinyl-diaminopimelate desuccinylase [Blastochloris tepida]|uniref:Succinyl-diaminopimelate desuccinylase n=1 Tax=Blastochloris tepida TaxID=2233851 RepID=A0A348G3J6_9HYPH|nr:succinyl-diaminopimelate desuccinylase [Blastochloris tepida]BBF94129.1 succinyl-diaminopimelate desuccinylase [Blastochloris tepida]